MRAAQPMLTLDDLKKMPPAEVTAVNACSGNRRGLFQPHVPGIEWGYGAMGVRPLERRAPQGHSRQGRRSRRTPSRSSSTAPTGRSSTRRQSSSRAFRSGRRWRRTALVAYEMNGQPLPHFNGFPARVIVPGWLGVYWMKHVVSLRAVTKPFDGYWMKTAYRIPVGKFPIRWRASSLRKRTLTRRSPNSCRTR